MHRRAHIVGGALAVSVPALGLVLAFGPAAGASTATSSQSAGVTAQVDGGVTPPASITAPYEDGVTPSVGVTAPYDDGVTPPAGVTGDFDDG